MDEEFSQKEKQQLPIAGVSRKPLLSRAPVSISNPIDGKASDSPAETLFFQFQTFLLLLVLSRGLLTDASQGL